MLKTTRALVLREVRYKEADKILTVLTEDEGKITVRARRASGRKSKIGAATEQLTFSEMTLFGNKGFWTLNEAETIEQFVGLRENIDTLSLGNYFAELIEAVSDEDTPNPAVLRLGLNSLFALSRKLYEPEHIKAVFEMRLMCLSGYEPTLDGCSVCGKSACSDMLLSINGGVMHCRTCNPGQAGVSLPLCEATVSAIRHIIEADEKKIFSFSLDERAKKMLYDICEAYVLACLERGFGALDYWKTVR
jgi:DNA repair protein RecO (recombination protein O)